MFPTQWFGVVVWLHNSHGEPNLSTQTHGTSPYTKYGLSMYYHLTRGSTVSRGINNVTSDDY